MRIFSGMSEERPPVTDAEYRVVRGPWPNWTYRLSLISLAVRTAAVVAACMAVAVILLVIFWPESA